MRSTPTSGLWRLQSSQPLCLRADGLPRASCPAGFRARGLRRSPPHGKRKKPAAASFFANLERELLALERQLRHGIYRPGRYVAFEVNDPKKRIVSAAPFRDRVVHHALCAVAEPIFEAGFIDHTFANRAGKGTHAAIETYERTAIGTPTCSAATSTGIFRRSITQS